MRNSTVDSDNTDLNEELSRDLPRTSASVIPLLQRVQSRFSYLSEDHLEAVAAYTHTPLSTIYGVATFYAQFRLQRPGKHLIRVCRGTACHVLGAGDVFAALEERLGISEGQTTADGLFTLESVRCLGCCSLAPALMVDDETYGRVTRDAIDPILDRSAAGGQP